MIEHVPLSTLCRQPEYDENPFIVLGNRLRISEVEILVASCAVASKIYLEKPPTEAFEKCMHFSSQGSRLLTTHHSSLARVRLAYTVRQMQLPEVWLPHVPAMSYAARRFEMRVGMLSKPNDLPIF